MCSYSMIHNKIPLAYVLYHYDMQFLPPCTLQTCQTSSLSFSPTFRQQSSSGSRTARAILRKAPSLILSRTVLWQPCCSWWSGRSLPTRSTSYTCTGASGGETCLGLVTMTMWTCCSTCMLVTWLRGRRARVRHCPLNCAISIGVYRQLMPDIHWWHTYCY